MNFLKKTLLALLVINFVVSSNVIARNSSQIARNSSKKEATEETSNKKTIIAATILGLGVATFVAYKYGAFDEDAFLRNNKVSDYLAEKTAPARALIAEKTSQACEYIAEKTAPTRTYLSEKSAVAQDFIKNKYASVKRYFGFETLKTQSHLPLDITTNTLSQDAKDVIFETAKETVKESVKTEESLSFFQRILQHIRGNTDLN